MQPRPVSLATTAQGGMLCHAWYLCLSRLSLAFFAMVWHGFALFAFVSIDFPVVASWPWSVPFVTMHLWELLVLLVFLICNTTYLLQPHMH